MYPFISPEINVGNIFYMKWSAKECKNILLVVTYDIKWGFFIVFYNISILWSLYLSGQPDLSGQSAISIDIFVLFRVTGKE